MRYVLKVILIIYLAVLSACTNRTTEETPDKIVIDGENIEERILFKNESDKKLAKVQEGLDGLKRAYSLYLQATKSKDKSYNSIDFITEISDELKEVLPKEVEGKLIREISIRNPLEQSSEGCEQVSSILEAQDRGEDSTQGTLTFLLRGCEVNHDYSPVLIVEWSGEEEMTLTIMEQSLKSIFSNRVGLTSRRETTCHFSFLKESSKNRVLCENLSISTGENSKVIFETLHLNREEGVSIYILGEVYKKGIYQFTFEITVNNNGKTNIDIKKVNKTETKLK